MTWWVDIRTPIFQMDKQFERGKVIQSSFWGHEITSSQNWTLPSAILVDGLPPHDDLSGCPVRSERRSSHRHVSGVSTAYASFMRVKTCGDLNENGPQRGLSRKDLWGAVLLEQVCHWGRGRCEASKVNTKPCLFPPPLLSSLSASWLWIKCKLLATAPTPCLSACCHVPRHHGFILWNSKQVPS